MRELYLESTFLDDAGCARIRAAMDRGVEEPAEILRNGASTDGHVRRATYLDVDEPTLAFVETRLESRRRSLAAWFALPLEAREGAGFVRYGPGGFYRPHRDRGTDPDWPDAARRRVAVVVFLNDDFSGGTLRLHGAEEGCSVDVAPARGSLVAFPADTLHEVLPVLAGTRDVIVDWFYLNCLPSE